MNKRRDSKDENNKLKWVKISVDIMWWVGSLPDNEKGKFSMIQQHPWFSEEMWKQDTIKRKGWKIPPRIFIGYILKWWHRLIFRTSTNPRHRCWKASGKLWLVSWNWARIASREWSHHALWKRLWRRKMPMLVLWYEKNNRKFKEKIVLMSNTAFYTLVEKGRG